MNSDTIKQNKKEKASKSNDQMKKSMHLIIYSDSKSEIDFLKVPLQEGHSRARGYHSDESSNESNMCLLCYC